MRELETTYISSVPDFFNEMVPSQGFQLETIYRGQADESWSLKPQLFRQDLEKSEFETWAELEASLIFRLKQRVNPRDLPGDLPHTELEWSALGQNFGLPTRFSTWSFNGLVALYFATQTVGDSYEELDGVVYSLMPGDRAMTVSQDFEQLPEHPQIYAPQQATSDTPVQQTCFLAHALPPQPDGDTESLEELYETSRTPRMHLARIIVPHDAKASIRQELAMMGIDAQRLFPGMHGLCDTIRSESYSPNKAHQWYVDQ